MASLDDLRVEFKDEVEPKEVKVKSRLDRPARSPAVPRVESYNDDNLRQTLEQHYDWRLVGAMNYQPHVRWMRTVDIAREVWGDIEFTRGFLSRLGRVITAIIKDTPGMTSRLRDGMRVVTTPHHQLTKYQRVS